MLFKNKRFIMIEKIWLFNNTYNYDSFTHMMTLPTYDDFFKVYSYFIFINFHSQAHELFLILYLFNPDHWVNLSLYFKDCPSAYSFPTQKNFYCAIYGDLIKYWRLLSYNFYLEHSCLLTWYKSTTCSKSVQINKIVLNIL